ncbi:MAG: cbb3-type cytochrome c oxidase subunit 3 [Gammaproteobacteria bacterium]|jgi:cytochrome c oxidase cbb3-type subunit 4|nr:MAG: cbb3-type cytochrome c oxidase subunit 3 [Gammaproteobacteria bacterium]
MDLPTLRGLFTLVLMIAFVVIVVWAWSSKRRKEFDEAARLPLEDGPLADQSGTARTAGTGAGEK